MSNPVSSYTPLNFYSINPPFPPFPSVFLGSWSNRSSEEKAGVMRSLLAPGAEGDMNALFRSLSRIEEVLDVLACLEGYVDLCREGKTQAVAARCFNLLLAAEEACLNFMHQDPVGKQLLKQLIRQFHACTLSLVPLAKSGLGIAHPFLRRHPVLFDVVDAEPELGPLPVILSLEEALLEGYRKSTDFGGIVTHLTNEHAARLKGSLSYNQRAWAVELANGGLFPLIIEYNHTLYKCYQMDLDLQQWMIEAVPVCLEIFQDPLMSVLLWEFTRPESDFVRLLLYACPRSNMDSYVSALNFLGFVLSARAWKEPEWVPRLIREAKLKTIAFEYRTQNDQGVTIKVQDGELVFFVTSEMFDIVGQWIEDMPELNELVIRLSPALLHFDSTGHKRTINEGDLPGSKKLKLEESHPRSPGGIPDSADFSTFGALDSAFKPVPSFLNKIESVIINDEISSPWNEKQWSAFLSILQPENVKVSCPLGLLYPSKENLEELNTLIIRKKIRLTLRARLSSVPKEEDDFNQLLDGLNRLSIKKIVLDFEHSEEFNDFLIRLKNFRHPFIISSDKLQLLQSWQYTEIVKALPSKRLAPRTELSIIQLIGDIVKQFGEHGDIAFDLINLRSVFSCNFIQNRNPVIWERLELASLDDSIGAIAGDEECDEEWMYFLGDLLDSNPAGFHYILDAHLAGYLSSKRIHLDLLESLLNFLNPPEVPGPCFPIEMDKLSLRYAKELSCVLVKGADLCQRFPDPMLWTFLLLYDGFCSEVLYSPLSAMLLCLLQNSETRGKLYETIRKNYRSSLVKLAIMEPMKRDLVLYPEFWRGILNLSDWVSPDEFDRVFFTHLLTKQLINADDLPDRAGDLFIELTAEKLLNASPAELPRWAAIAFPRADHVVSCLLGMEGAGSNGADFNSRRRQALGLLYKKGWIPTLEAFSSNPARMAVALIPLLSASLPHLHPKMEVWIKYLVGHSQDIENLTIEEQEGFNQLLDFYIFSRKNFPLNFSPRAFVHLPVVAKHLFQEFVTGCEGIIESVTFSVYLRFVVDCFLYIPRQEPKLIKRMCLKLISICALERYFVPHKEQIADLLYNLLSKLDENEIIDVVKIFKKLDAKSEFRTQCHPCAFVFAYIAIARNKSLDEPTLRLAVDTLMDERVPALEFSLFPKNQSTVARFFPLALATVAEKGELLNPSLFLPLWEQFLKELESGASRENSLKMAEILVKFLMCRGSNLGDLAWQSVRSFCQDVPQQGNLMKEAIEGILRSENFDEEDWQTKGQWRSIVSLISILPPLDLKAQTALAGLFADWKWPGAPSDLLTQPVIYEALVKKVSKECKKGNTKYACSFIQSSNRLPSCRDVPIMRELFTALGTLDVRLLRLIAERFPEKKEELLGRDLTANEIRFFSSYAYVFNWTAIFKAPALLANEPDLFKKQILECVNRQFLNVYQEFFSRLPQAIAKNFNCMAFLEKAVAKALKHPYFQIRRVDEAAVSSETRRVAVELIAVWKDIFVPLRAIEAVEAGIVKGKIDPKLLKEWFKNHLPPDSGEETIDAAFREATVTLPDAWIAHLLAHLA